MVQVERNKYRLCIVWFSLYYEARCKTFKAKVAILLYFCFLILFVIQVEISARIWHICICIVEKLLYVKNITLLAHWKLLQSVSDFTPV